MKKLSILFLALVASSGLWAADFEVDGIAYNKLGGDSVEVTSKSPKYADSITIPASVTYSSATYRVTSIGYWAFDNCRSLSTITIPNSVTSIRSSAFGSCTSLSSIILPNSVTSIGGEAFGGCTSLSSITIPNSVTGIGKYAFSNCSSLTSINVDAANTHYASIDGVLFNYAKDTLIQYPIGNKRTTYTIPNSVTSIGYVAFMFCTSLSSITIPNSVTSIGERAFYYCTSLSSITIPNRVISIGAEAFEYCSSLPSITIPNSVTSIGKYAFSKCFSFTSITCYATTPPDCGYCCFYNVIKSIPLYVPEGSIDAYKAADEWKDFTNIKAIATDIKNVNENVNVNANVNRKVMKDGKVVIILKDGHSYTLFGTPIE